MNCGCTVQPQPPTLPTLYTYRPEDIGLVDDVQKLSRLFLLVFRDVSDDRSPTCSQLQSTRDTTRQIDC